MSAVPGGLVLGTRVRALMVRAGIDLSALARLIDRDRGTSSALCGERGAGASPLSGARPSSSTRTPERSRGGPTSRESSPRAREGTRRRPLSLPGISAGAGLALRAIVEPVDDESYEPGGQEFERIARMTDEEFERHQEKS